MDANLYNAPLTEYPRIPWILWTSLDYPWMPTYTITPWQSIHGFPGYSGHPWIIRGCQPIQCPLDRVSTDSLHTLDIPGLSVDANLYNTPLDRVSTDSLDTLDILRLSVDANLYNTPLTDYPRIPRILWTSLDYPWMPTYTITPWQSIHGFPGYSGHPWIIRGCQPIQYPLDRVSTDSLDTLDILRLSVDANLYNTPLTEYPRIPRILWTSLDYPWMPTYTMPP